MLEAAAIALTVRRTPLVATYHCDVMLPRGLVNAAQVLALDASHRVAIRRASQTIVSSVDYARSSRLWCVLEGRHIAIPPPCLHRGDGNPTFRDGPGLHVGFLGRIVAEKGLEYLVDGFRSRADDMSRLLIGGDFANVAGGSVVERIRQHTGDDPRIRLLGFLPEKSLADFFASLDVFALPSVNSLEAFGIVQAEAMMAAVPVIASDLPGVRTVVGSTGFGRIVPPRNAEAIRAALDSIMAEPLGRNEGAAKALELYSAETVIDQYEATLEGLIC
jgi:glycosyltransferase involved in cell wall biosynthesis